MKPGLGLALYQPEIAGNTGTLVRFSACWGVALHLIHPLGFVWSGAALRRAGLDYHDHALVDHHDAWRDFQMATQEKGQRRVAAVPGQGPSYWDFAFTSQDVIVLGAEQKGLPLAALEDCHACVHIPMRPGSRSLNLAMAGALVLGEAVRQTRLTPPFRAGQTE